MSSFMLCFEIFSSSLKKKYLEFCKVLLECICVFMYLYGLIYILW